MRLKSNAVWHSLPGVEAVYQPIGAPSPVDALLNVGHDHRSVGKHTATPVVLPAHDQRVGWLFTGTQYLTVGLRPEQTWSVLVRFSNHTTGLCFVLGTYSAPIWGFYLFGGATQRYWLNGNEKSIVAVAFSGGVLGLAGVKSFWNGLPTGLADNAGFAGSVSAAGIGIGATATGSYKLVANIQNIVIASRTFSADEMWMASRQMQYCEQNPDWNAWGRRRQYFYAPSAAFNAAWAARTNRLIGGGLS